MTDTNKAASPEREAEDWPEEAGRPWQGDLAEALTMTGCSDLADLIDMANVGNGLMERIDRLTKVEGPFKGWTPADDPCEIVFDLVNALEDALSLPVQSVEGEPSAWAFEYLTGARSDDPSWEPGVSTQNPETWTGFSIRNIRALYASPPKPSEAPAYDIDSFADIYAKPVEAPSSEIRRLVDEHAEYVRGEKINQTHIVRAAAVLASRVRALADSGTTEAPAMGWKATLQSASRQLWNADYNLSQPTNTPPDQTTVARAIQEVARFIDAALAASIPDRAPDQYADAGKMIPESAGQSLGDAS